jgi:putative transcriptional regulator
MTKSGSRLIKAAKEAVAIARGEKKPARIHVPLDINIRSIRSKLDLSQDDFAAGFGFTTNQIKDWEQGRSRPIGGVRAYLMLIEKDPKMVSNALRELTKSARKRAAA